MNIKNLMFPRMNLTKTQREIFFKEQAFANFSCSSVLTLTLFLINIILLYTDYLNWQRGLWSEVLSYKYLFYMHLLFGIVIGFLLVLSCYIKKMNIKNEYPHYRLFSLFFSIFILIFTAVLSGAVDQLIHNQISIYILATLTIAFTNYFKPIIGFSLYLISYLIFLILLSKFQSNLSILIGNLINGTISVFIAWLLSLFHYSMKIKDFFTKNLLEELVKERTSQLELTNQQLKTEINERKQIQVKIKRLATIVESTDDGILGMSPDGVILDWNAGASRIYGYSANEIVGKTIFELVPPERHPEVEDILTKVNKGERIRHFETIRQGKDGRLIYVSLTISPIVDEAGAIIGASTIIRDVSEIKQMQNQMQRLSQLNLIGEMAAGISHEVRNPMTTVMGFLQLLGEREEFVSFKNHFKLMIDELNRGNAIITEFLSIGKTKPTELERHNLKTIVQTLFPLLEADAMRSEKSVLIETEEVPDLVVNDKEIRQVILNLARNGLEAMKAGGQLTIRTYETEAEVILSVQDQGKGIEPSVLEKLGTPFLTTKENGTGLGIAVCFGIAARNQAVISVETGSNGTTFFVRFKPSTLARGISQQE